MSGSGGVRAYIFGSGRVRALQLGPFPTLWRGTHRIITGSFALCSQKRNCGKVYRIAYHFAVWKAIHALVFCDKK